MPRRRRAREVVLQILFQDDLNSDTDPEDADAFLRRRLRGNETLIAFARPLIEGVRARRDQLDGLLVESAENWTLGRMAATDRNVLRLALFEMFFADTPAPVAINEAVELAKRFGAAQSPSFVNALLDRIQKVHGAFLKNEMRE